MPLERTRARGIGARVTVGRNDWKGVTTGAPDPEQLKVQQPSAERSPMSSHPCDQPVSAPQARMIEGMRVHGFGERLRGFYSTLMVPIDNRWWPASITV